MLRMNHLLGIGMVTLLTAAPAFSAVAYYRFEDNLTSQDNSPTLDATAGPTAGYSSDIPGAGIYDPWANTTVANTKSYDQGVSTTGSSLSDTSILNNTVNSGSFTIEAFIKLTSNDINDLKFDLILGNMDGGGTQGWAFGLDGNGKLRFGAVQANGPAYKGVNSTDAITSGVWHHVAAVGRFDDRTSGTAAAVDFTDVRLYVDYVDVTEQSGSAIRYFGSSSSGDPGAKGPVFNTSSNNFTIGAINPFSGLIDELRISDSPLNTDQMLQAVPEPASLSLLGLGAAALLMRRRR